MLDETKLFDFIKIMFDKPKEYKAIKQHTKKRHFFMINRFFAIKFPENAQMFNRTGIDGASVVDAWWMVAQRFKGVPMWIYTKTKKTAVTKSTSKKQEYIPSEEAIAFFMQKNEIGKREFKELELFAADALLEDLQQIDRAMKVK